MRETAQELPRKAKSRRVKPCPPPSERNPGVRTLGTPGCSHAVGRDSPRALTGRRLPRQSKTSSRLSRFSAVCRI